MPNTQIPFQSTGYFTQLITDYIARKDSIKHLYGNFPDMSGFENQIQLKESQFSTESRMLLNKSLLAQYSKTNSTESSVKNIAYLKETNTFTVVTGHQLNIFTGPLYFLFKIVSTINLAKELKQNFPNKNFVPVYWMATEDHDFEEINHFFVGDAKISWEVGSSGPVGRKSTKSMEPVFQEFSEVLGAGKNAKYLIELFQKAYLEHSTLTEATRFLVNELFGDQGLLIIDGDDPRLKEQFAGFVKRELLTEYAHRAIADTNDFLEATYKVQVNPREINLFYIEDAIRERIVYENDLYKVNNTDLKFSKDEMLELLKKSPEKFSPNVILRPLFQEVVLPNLCYIGGGGELAYWLQLKNLFVESEVAFPILLLRNSVLISSKKQGKKLSQLNLEYKDLFLKQDKLFDKIVAECSSLELNFDHQRMALNKIFQGLKPLVSKTDITFKGALEAQEKKQLKGLLNLEKRLLKAEKKKHADLLDRARMLQTALFPRNGLQERNVNFAEFYKEYGDAFISILLKELKPLSLEYSVLEL